MTSDQLTAFASNGGFTPSACAVLLLSGLFAVLLLWGATGGVGRNHKSMEIWPRYASDIRAGKALPCGHYLSEEAPEETYRGLRDFFAAAKQDGS